MNAPHWLETAGNRVKAARELLAIGMLALSGVAYAGAWYVDRQIESKVAQAIQDFRVEWRCSEWREELEDKRYELRLEMPDAEERLRLENRIERLQGLITENRCARFET